tara:strand:+ start:195 stop:452 length:258 start_codon:yes stop_codon:yes gene_type:complete
VSIKNKDVICFNSILEKIKDLDCSIEDFKSKINKLQKDICNKDFDESDPESEICIDELESEKAILEMMKDGYLEKIGQNIPEGDL